MNRMYHALRTLFRRPLPTRRPQRPPALGIEILEDRVMPANTFQSLIGLDQVQAQYPYRGSGYTVALLDTGINYNLASLGGGIGAGHRVIYGYNFLNNTTNALDNNGHGTFLANMIGGSDQANPGIDPQVQFADLKVLDANMNGTWAAIDSALQWVIANKTQDHIAAINMSFSSGNYTSDQFSLLETDLATLKNMGVFIAVASGNNFAAGNSQPGLSYPAVDPDVVSVGATWADNFGAQTFNGATDASTAPHQLASFTQRDSALSILAPGVWLNGVTKDGTPIQMGGTSMSTAVVTGAAVLLHQALDQTGQSSLATEAGILQLMQSTGNTVIDNNPGTNVHDTGLSFKELNLAAAMNAALQVKGSPTLGAISNQTMQVGQTISVTLPSNQSASLPLTYSVQKYYLPALAYQLQQQVGLSFAGDYYTNGEGAGEKWLAGNNQNWYWIMPNGDLRRWADSVAATLTSANLIATLDPSYYADPSKLWNASSQGNPPAVLTLNGNTLSIRSTSYWVGTYTVVVSATNGQQTAAQSFQVTVTPALTPPVLNPIADQTQAHGKDVVVGLSATSSTGGLTYAAQVLPVNGQAPPMSVSVQGNQLTVHPQQPLVGTFAIQVTVSAGGLTATRTFNVTLTNTAPVFSAIAALTLAKGQTNLTIPLPVSDADNDKLSFQASIQTPNATAYNLNLQYAFQPSNATYYFNIQGQNEKWLLDKNGLWYALLPSGQLYRWSFDMTQTLKPANLIATLDPSIYNQPQLLWNAQPATTPGLTYSFQGNQLTLQRPANLTGVFVITITVSDGFTTTQRTFQVTLN